MTLADFRAMSNHTPTPWRKRAWHSAYIEDSESRTVAYADTDNDAEFIVRACNAHDEMLAALRDLVAFVSPGDDIPFAAMLDAARAAIAKATK